jgi:tetratricopeptide (TPR) repeat protein
MCDATNGSVIWSGSLRGTKDEVLLSEEGIGTQCAQRLVQATMSHELLRSQSSPLPLLSSHTLLFSAISLMHRMSRTDLMRGQALLEQLRERHPRAPEPHAWYAKWHVMRVVQGWSEQPEADAKAGRACALRALEERSNHSLGLAVDGLILGLLQGDLTQSGQRYEAAIAANPNEALAWLFQSALLAYTDRGEEAARSAERAMSLSPLDPVRYFYDSFAAHAMIAAGRHAEAVTYAERSLRSNASHLPTFRSLAIAHGLTGNRSAARSTVERLLKLSPDYSVSRFMRTYPGRDSKLARISAQTLAEAGLPGN